MSYIDNFYCIYSLFFIVLSSIRGKPPLSTNNSIKMSVFWSIIYLFQSDSILSQDLGLIRKNHIYFNKANIQVREQYQQQYEDLLTKHHDVFSKSNIDIGKENHFEHDIHFKRSPGWSCSLTRC